ncbi:MAG: hypothetical protein IJW99_02455 [Clostridia bacterium]|nr:hypothetical protein [Clostridia bacterium]
MERKIDIRRLVRNALTVLIMTGLIAYIVYHCLQYFKDPVQTTAVLRRSEKETQQLTAYIFRDETVLRSPESGALRTLYEDGVHVPVDSEVARVYVSRDGERLYARLQELGAEIAFYEQCMDTAGMSQIDLPALNEEIAKLYGETMNAATSGDGAMADRLSRELLVLINRRDILTGELADMPAKYAALQAQKRALEAEYAGTYASVVTEKSGYYFRETDGYEAWYTNEALRTMTFDGFFELIERAPTSTAQDAGKMIGDYIWYVAVPTVKSESQTLSEGENYPITFADGVTTLSMTLDRILTQAGDERCVLIFRTGQMPAGFDYTRRQTVTVGVGETSGLRVPQTAILVGKDGEMGVYVLDVARVRYRRIEVIWRGDGYVLARETDRTAEGHENDLGYQELVIIGSDEELYDGKLLY